MAIEKLCDAAATRDGVVQTFRTHLGQAGSGDTEVFWFSGHGSTAPVPDRWWYLEPSGRLQTLICHDSRSDDVPDLLDKELAVLIAEVRRGGAHVAVMLDCCHAAGATRAHRAATARRIRGLTVAPDLGRLLPELRAYGAVRASGRPPDHVGLAACRTDELAFEYRVDGRYRGAFSHALLSELRRPGAPPTYRELIVGARCRLERVIERQVPMLRPVDGALADQPFLGGQVRPPVSSMTMRHDGESWRIDAGACHGLGAGAEGDEAVIAVCDTEPAQEARVAEVYAGHSTVVPVGWRPDPNVRYPVVLAR